jgi:hypothetical protein
MLKRGLIFEGYTVETVEDGEAGLRKLLVHLQY